MLSSIVVSTILECSTLLSAVPQVVTSLTVKDVNTTAIQLTWLGQPDYKDPFSYLVFARQAGTVVQNDTTTSEAYTFSNLTPGALYDFEVVAVVEGVKSEAATISINTSKTGLFVAD